MPLSGSPSNFSGFCVEPVSHAATRYGSFMKILRALALFSVVAVAPSCGGGGESSTSEADFCEYLSTLEDIDPEAAPDDAVAAIDQIIDRAPDGEIKGALEDLRPIFEAMVNIDPNDEAAFGEIMSLMFDPKVIAAGEVLEKYGTEVCGFEDTSSDSPADTSGDWTTDPDMTVQPSSFEDLESGQISDAVTAVLADLAPDAYVASSGWSSMGAGFSVDVDVSGTDDVDGVPLCDAVGELLTDTDPEAAFTISITLDGTPIARGDSDSGGCESVTG